MKYSSKHFTFTGFSQILVDVCCMNGIMVQKSLVRGWKIFLMFLNNISYAQQGCTFIKIQ